VRELFQTKVSMFSVGSDGSFNLKPYAVVS